MPDEAAQVIGHARVRVLLERQAQEHGDMSPELGVRKARGELRNRRDRDAAALERTMRELDAAEQAARGSRELPTLAPDEVRGYLEHLPDWWRDADAEDRRALAVTLFELIRVLGVDRVRVEPSQEARRHRLADAVGPDEVVMVGATDLNAPGPTSTSRSPGGCPFAWSRCTMARQVGAS